MRRGSAWIALSALGLAALLLALSMLTWRQSRAREAMAELDRLHREISLVQAERAALERRIQILESRMHVVPTAREQLGLRRAESNDIVLLTWGSADTSRPSEVAHLPSARRQP
jgi:Flp pilus assembly protein TadB